MNPLDMMKKTILAESTKLNSDFVDVLHRGELKKAKVEYGDFRKIDKSEDNVKFIQDEISFLNMSSDYLSRGDSIEFDNIVYYIDNFSIVVTGVYNIYAVKKVETGGMF